MGKGKRDTTAVKTLNRQSLRQRQSTCWYRSFLLVLVVAILLAWRCHWRGAIQTVQFLVPPPIIALRFLLVPKTSWTAAKQHPTTTAPVTRPIRRHQLLRRHPRLHQCQLQQERRLVLPCPALLAWRAKLEQGTVATPAEAAARDQALNVGTRWLFNNNAALRQRSCRGSGALVCNTLNPLLNEFSWPGVNYTDSAADTEPPTAAPAQVVSVDNGQLARELPRYRGPIKTWASS
jgi:hypothetical protein